MKNLLAIFFLLTFIYSCNEKKVQNEKELWIYTSMYKDTIADITPKLKKAFPGVNFRWYQAGSEDIATKVNAEILAGNLRADVLISSDRFWYEEMANLEHLIAYSPKSSTSIPDSLKHPKGFYTTVSIPVMVLCYNNEAIAKSEAPTTFKELIEQKWKDKFTTGSPLSSGTNFTTMAVLQHHYGWDFFKKLKTNNTIAQGGNSSVIRRIQSKERPVGWVLLENILRFQGKDNRLIPVFPEDGVVIHNNVMAITNKKSGRSLAKNFVDWMLSKAGQDAMVRSYMYSPITSFPPPKGAPELGKILGKSFPWTRDFIENVTEQRTAIKEKYTEIMFQ